jgi:hypothetical protein
MRSSVLVALVLAGCDPLASTDYVGEPMFTLSGTFAATGGRTSDDPVGGLALLWQDSAGPGGPGVATTTVPVTLGFPATFHVAVPLPPPDAARFTLDTGGAQLAEAYIFVVADPSAPQLAPRGLDRSHVLVYASADVAPGSLAADYLGGDLTAGYHLRHFGAATPGVAQTAMIERCVANGAERATCETRRGYQLGAIPDDDPLKIVVMP